MNKNVPKRPDSILEGVVWSVKTCEYNTENGNCMAAEIEVQPKNATNCEQTDCVTFKPRGNC